MKNQYSLIVLLCSALGIIGTFLSTPLICMDTNSQKTASFKIIDFNREMISRVIVQIDSVPYQNPETVSLTYNEKDKFAQIAYSGLSVTFGQHQDQGPQVVHKPGTKKISLQQFQELAKMFEKNTEWYAPQNTEARPSNHPMGEASIFLETRPKNNLSGPPIRIMLIDLSYFKEGASTTEFFAIIRKAGILYGRDITDVAHYD